MIRYVLSVVVLVLVAVIVQQFLPVLTGIFGSRVLLVPLVFLCASVTVNTPVMLALAFLCGFLSDAQNWMGPHGGDPEVYVRPAESLYFGYSIVLYGVIGYLMQGIQPLFRAGKWQFSAMLSGIAVFVYLLAEYLLINFVRGEFFFNYPTLFKIGFSSAMTMMLSPLVFWVLFNLAEAFGYRITFTGLAKTKRKPATLTA